MKRIVPILVFAGVLGVPLSAQQPTATRQFYTVWYKHDRFDYHYRKYFFKTNSSDKSYRFQYVIFKPTKSRDWVYWYDPETKEYWARCATKENQMHRQGVLSCKTLWSILPKDKRKAILDHILDDAWGDVQDDAPEIPNSTDQKHIDCPPVDLPR